MSRPQRPRTAPTGSGGPAGPQGALRGAQSELEAILANRLALAGLPLGRPQHPVAPGRRWRFDRAWPEQMVAVEVQGGIWSRGRHARGSGIVADCEKFSTAAALGWRVLPVTREMIESGQAVELIRQALEPARAAGEG